MRRAHIAWLSAVLLFAGNAFASEPPEAFETKYCSGCHAVDKKMVGPALKEVAKKHGAKSDAEAYLIEKITKGGSGVWGQVPMPPTANLAPADAKALAQWILKLK